MKRYVLFFVLLMFLVGCAGNKPVTLNNGFVTDPNYYSFSVQLPESTEFIKAERFMEESHSELRLKYKINSFIWANVSKKVLRDNYYWRTNFEKELKNTIFYKGNNQGKKSLLFLTKNNGFYLLVGATSLYRGGVKVEVEFWTGIDIKGLDKISIEEWVNSQPTELENLKKILLGVHDSIQFN